MKKTADQVAYERLIQKFNTLEHGLICAIVGVYFIVGTLVYHLYFG